MAELLLSHLDLPPPWILKETLEGLPGRVELIAPLKPPWIELAAILHYPEPPDLIEWTHWQLDWETPYYCHTLRLTIVQIEAYRLHRRKGISLTWHCAESDFRQTHFERYKP